MKDNSTYKWEEDACGQPDGKETENFGMKYRNEKNTK